MDEDNFSVSQCVRFGQKGFQIKITTNILSNDDVQQLAYYISKKEDLISIDFGQLNFDKNDIKAMSSLGQAIANKSSLKEVISDFKYSEFTRENLYCFYELMLSNLNLISLDSPKEMIATFNSELKFIKLMKKHAVANSELRFMDGMTDVYRNYKDALKVDMKNKNLRVLMSDVRELTDVLTNKTLSLALDYVKFISDPKNFDSKGNFSILPCQNRLGRFQDNKSMILNVLGGKKSVESYLSKLNDPFVRALNKIFSSDILSSMMASAARHKLYCVSYFKDSDLLLGEEIIKTQLKYFDRFYTHNYMLNFAKPHCKEGMLTLQNRTDFEELMQKNPNDFNMDDLQSLILQANQKHCALSIEKNGMKTTRFNESAAKKIADLSILEDASIVRDPAKNNNFYRSRVTRSEKLAQSRGFI